MGLVRSSVRASYVFREKGCAFSRESLFSSNHILSFGTLLGHCRSGVEAKHCFNVLRSVTWLPTNDANALAVKFPLAGFRRRPQLQHEGPRKRGRATSNKMDRGEFIDRTEAEGPHFGCSQAYVRKYRLREGQAAEDLHPQHPEVLDLPSAHVCAQEFAHRGVSRRAGDSGQFKHRQSRADHRVACHPDCATRVGNLHAGEPRTHGAPAARAARTVAATASGRGRSVAGGARIPRKFLCEFQMGSKRQVVARSCARAQRSTCATRAVVPVPRRFAATGARSMSNVARRSLASTGDMSDRGCFFLRLTAMRWTWRSSACAFGLKDFAPCLRH